MQAVLGVNSPGDVIVPITNSSGCVLDVEEDVETAAHACKYMSGISFSYMHINLVVHTELS